jgi:hypothetical protein
MRCHNDCSIRRQLRKIRASGTRSHADAQTFSDNDKTWDRSDIPRRIRRRHDSHYLGSMKRVHEGDDDGEHPAKVQRLLHPDKISRLSEELLVRILSFVPVPSLLVCQR